MNFLIYLAALLCFSFSVHAGRMNVAKFYNEANFENLEPLCTEFYHREVRFKDPLGDISGRTKLIDYYKHLYENVVSIDFETKKTMSAENETVYFWVMNVRHKSVGGEEPIRVEGVSRLIYEGDKVIFHQDYFDLGSMLYEKIPLLGRLILWVKNKAHGSDS